MANLLAISSRLSGIVVLQPAPMCSRYTYNKHEAKLKLRDQILVFGCVPRGDIRPTDLGPVVLPDDDDFVCREMIWGWRVPWDKQPLINAKSETITQLPTFKPHLQNRCLILADGFFEKGIRFIQPGEPLFVMAGLWQPDAAGGRLTMLTTTPNASVSPYHHRMPFILRAEQLGAWLGDDWLAVLENPDRTLLEKIYKQPELFYSTGNWSRSRHDGQNINSHYSFWRWQSGGLLPETFPRTIGTERPKCV